MPVIPDPSSPAPSIGTAVARESEWLCVVGDSLPTLLAEYGGPWEVVQAYWPGARWAKDKHGIYVDARTVADPRVSNARIRSQYQFTLTLTWPVKGQGSGGAGTSNLSLIAETEQQNLDSAVALVIQRIRGPLGDKSHGGRFLSVAENPRTVNYTKQDAAVTIPQRMLRATLAYRADDYEVNG